MTVSVRRRWYSAAVIERPNGQREQTVWCHDFETLHLSIRWRLEAGPAKVVYLVHAFPKAAAVHDRTKGQGQ